MTIHEASFFGMTVRRLPRRRLWRDTAIIAMVMEITPLALKISTTSSIPTSKRTAAAAGVILAISVWAWMGVGTGIVKEAVLTAEAMATIVTTGVATTAALGVAAGIPAEVAKILPYTIITEKTMDTIITEKWEAAAALWAGGEAAAQGENATIVAGIGAVARRLTAEGSTATAGTGKASGKEMVAVLGVGPGPMASMAIITVTSTTEGMARGLRCCGDPAAGEAATTKGPMR